MIRALKTLGLAALLVLATVNHHPPSAAEEVVVPAGPAIRVDVGKGELLRLDRDADTVFVADPEIADVKIKTARLIYIYGKTPGETSLYAVDAEQHVITNKPVVVKRDVGRLQAALDEMVPDGAVDVKSIDGALVLEGHVDTPGESEEARRLARTYVTDDKLLINHISVDAPNQVNLRVRLAEVQHNVVKDLGINWDAIGHVGDFALGLATGTPAMSGLQNSLTPTPLNFITRNTVNGGTTDSLFGGVNTPSANVDAVIDALDQNGLVNILAEPNLTALSGETASFLSGGEFPILVPGQNGTVTIEFKQFGVALAFTPVILAGGRISMRVRPEVSQITTTGQVQINGFTIPALATRRAETTIELGSGQTFAIGGLLQNNINETVSKVPGLNELPVLGALFRSQQFQRNESELVILVTPYLVHAVSDKRMATPRDGYKPPTDFDLVLRGQTERPSAPQTGVPPSTPGGNAVIGPAGFILQ